MFTRRLSGGGAAGGMWSYPRMVLHRCGFTLAWIKCTMELTDNQRPAASTVHVQDSAVAQSARTSVVQSARGSSVLNRGPRGSIFA